MNMMGTYINEIISRIAEGICLSRRSDDIIVYTNPKFEKMFGYDIGEMVGKNVSMINAPTKEKPKETEKDILAVLNKKGEWKGEVNNIKKNGTTFWCNANLSLFEHPEFGSVLISTYIDITDRKLAEEALLCSENRYGGILQNLEAAIVVHAPDTSIVMSNPRASELLGLSKEQMKGKEAIDPAWKFVDEENIPLSLKNYPVNKIITSRKPIQNQIVGIHRPNTNDLVWVSVNGFPVLNSQNEITEIGITFIDITERKQAEEAIKEKETALRNAQKVANVGSWQFDVKSQIPIWSEQMFVVFGLDHAKGELDYAGHKKIIHPDDWQAFDDAVQRTSQTGNGYDLEIRIVTPSGEVRWINTKCETLKNAKGKVIKLIGTCQDITESKQAMIDMKELGELNNMILETAGEGIYGLDLEGKTTFVNPAAAKMIGWKVEDIIGKSQHDLMHHTKADGTAYDRGDCPIYSAFSDGKIHHIDDEVFWRKDGSSFPVEYISNPIRDEQGELKGAVVTFDDITNRKKTENELRLNKFAIENAGDTILWINPDAKIVDCNDAACRMLGYTKREMLQFSIPDINPNYSIEAWPNHFAEIRKKGTLKSYETQQRAKDGRLIDVEVTANYIKTRDSEYSCSFIRDITERKQAAEIREIVIHDKGKRIKELNCIYKLSESIRTRETLDEIMQDAANFIPPGWHYPEITRAKIIFDGKVFLSQTFKETKWKQSSDIVLHNKHRGSIEVYYLEECPELDEGPFLSEERVLIDTIAKNIGEAILRKQAIDEVINAETKFHTLFDSTTDAILVSDQNSFIDCNAAALKMFGIKSRTELQSKHPSDLSPPLQPDGADSLSLANQHVSKALRKGSFMFEWVHWRLDNKETFPADVQLTRMELHGRDIIQGAIRDITKRKQAEKELQASEEQNRSITQTAPNAIISISSTGIILSWNKAAEKIFGYSSYEMINEKPTKIMPLCYRTGYNAEMQRISQGGKEKLLGKITELTALRKDGTEFPIDLSLSSWEANNQKYYTGIIRDITALKRSEKIQKILYNISAAVGTSNNLGQLISLIRDELEQIIDTSNFYIALFDYKTDTFSLPFLLDEKMKISSFPAGKTFTKYVLKTQKSLLANKERMKKLVEAGDVERLGASAEVWLGVPLMVAKKAIGVLALQSYTDEFAYDKSDVKMLEFVSDQISSSVYRKGAEQDLKDALKKATESDRLKSTFLATMSHELRTPLNAIIGFSDSINKNTSLPDILSYGKIINASGKHLLSIVENLFDIALIESGQINTINEEVKLASVLDDVQKIIEMEQRKRNKSQLELKLLLPPEGSDLIIHIDRSKLKQILLNLLNNALKYTHDGRIEFGYSIRVKNDGAAEISGKVTENKSPDLPMLDLDSIKVSKEIEFFVKDTGIGIPKDKLELIFENFRQVEEADLKTFGGAGLGLSISRKLTELLGGNIWLKSIPGKGSEFYFTIPLKEYYHAEKPAITKTKEEVETDVEQKTVLVVEDDVDSFKYIKLILSMSENNILWAKNGEEAVNYCNDNPSIDMVLMDINMPIMNGYDATREIKKFRPNLPIIAQTALARAGDKKKVLDAGCDDYITKPIDPTLLVDMIEKHLTN